MGYNLNRTVTIRLVKNAYLVSKFYMWPTSQATFLSTASKLCVVSQHFQTDGPHNFFMALVTNFELNSTPNGGIISEKRLLLAAIMSEIVKTINISMSQANILKQIHNTITDFTI
jgi:hypothetical protein